jgi:capsular polysaccharide biosynthesis protein/Mrp family chromosome partitioning ATPase
MEIKEFFKLLLKYKYILIVIPLVTVTISFFLVRHLPDVYESDGQIATGLVDQNRQILDPFGINLQENKIYGQFSNLIEMMKLKKMMDMVSYKLIIHDLDGKDIPFKPMPKDYLQMTAADKTAAIAKYTYKLQHLEPLSLYDKYEKWLNDLIIEKGYDENTLRKAIVIYRDDNSDFITIMATSENPQLSALMINSLCQGFISYYSYVVKENQATAVNYLFKLLQEKRQVLSDKLDSLQKYRIKNGILNLDDQSKTVSNQIYANNEKLLQAQKEVESYSGTIANIEKKFQPGERKYLESQIMPSNVEVTGIYDKMHALTDQYVRSGFDPKLKVSIDSLQQQLVSQMNQTSDKYISNPMIGKDELVRQRNVLQVSSDLAKYSIKTIQNELQKLNARYNALVPLDAKLKAYNFDIDNATKEYQDVLAKYNYTNLQNNSASKLMQVEYASPERAKPSKKMLLVILSGLVSGVFCVMVLFVVFFLDDSVKSPTQLSNATHLPVLGYLNYISGSSIDLRKLWDVEHRDKMQQFKDLLRSIRFEIDQELDGDKVLGITSMRGGEGKTLLAISLAYSYSMINKKVLLIDGNFDNPTISKTVNPKLYIEEVFKNTPGKHTPLSNTNSVIGNYGGDITLLEIADEQFVRDRLNELKSMYDVILIEVPALENMNKAKEWLLFTNKFISVFEAGQSIGASKKQLVKYLKAMDLKFAGWVLNRAVYNTKKKEKR